MQVIISPMSPFIKNGILVLKALAVIEFREDTDAVPGVPPLRRIDSSDSAPENLCVKTAQVPGVYETDAVMLLFAIPTISVAVGRKNAWIPLVTEIRLLLAFTAVSDATAKTV